jgi:hypothetical protein
MYIIYDYFLLIGDKSWYMPPASVITTKNVDSLNVTQANVTAASAAEVVARATGSSDGGRAATTTTSEPAKAAAKPAVKKTSTPAPAPH